MQGNVYTWCQESYAPYPSVKEGEVVEDREGKLVIDSEGPRVVRGGSFGSRALSVRSANRGVAAATDRTNNLGFRPARTFIP